MGTTSYYLHDRSAGTGPALWRKVGADPAQELIEGVEGFQVRYGVDSDHDTYQSADRYVAADKFPATVPSGSDCVSSNSW